MYKVHHPKADIDRLYVKRKEGGRGLVQVEAAYKAEITSIAEYLNTNYKVDQFVNIVKSYESTQPTMNSIIKTAAKIAEELSNQMRRVRHNRKEYNIQGQDWERF
jgi:ribosomal protein L11 methylase PrmA